MLWHSLWQSAEALVSGTYHVQVRPMRTGQVTLQGVAWILNGVAHSFRPFPSPQEAPPAGRCMPGNL